MLKVKVTAVNNPPFSPLQSAMLNVVHVSTKLNSPGPGERAPDLRQALYPNRAAPQSFNAVEPRKAKLLN